MFDESTVQLGGGDLVRVPELSARLTVGDRGYVSHCAYVVARLYAQHLGFRMFSRLNNRP